MIIFMNAFPGGLKQGVRHVQLSLDGHFNASGGMGNQCNKLNEKLCKGPHSPNPDPAHIL